MFKKILTLILISIFSFTLTGCNNTYKTYDYKNKVSQLAFNGWRDELKLLTDSKDFELIYNGEEHRTKKILYADKELEHIQKDVIKKEVIKVDLTNTLVSNKKNHSVYDKEITRNGKKESKSKRDYDYSYQMIDNKFYELDDNSKEGHLYLLGYDYLLKNILDPHFVSIYINSCQTFYVDKNVYTAIKETNNERIICQIVVNNNSITLISKYEYNTELNDDGYIVKITDKMMNSYTYNIKDIKLTPKDVTNYYIYKMQE